MNDERDSHFGSSSVQQHPQTGEVREQEYSDEPEFRKHAEATNSEVFFDLFFAANLTVFSDSHDVTDLKVLSGYIAYFSVLWLTWALISLYDVRFVTDSIFGKSPQPGYEDQHVADLLRIERITRAFHLGVMVGISVVAPNFDPTAQVKSTFRVMCKTLSTGSSVDAQTSVLQV